MGMFDDHKPFSDTFKEKQVFTLLDAKIGPVMDTEHGEGTPVLLRIKTDETPQGEWFSVWGQALVSQVERMDEGELRQGVQAAIARKSNKKGNQDYKVLVTADQLNDEDTPF